MVGKALTVIVLIFSRAMHTMQYCINSKCGSEEHKLTTSIKAGESRLKLDWELFEILTL